MVRRGLADSLAESEEERHEREAMEIYRQFQEEGVERSEADYLHNYATLLYKHDYDDVAGRYWHRAYGMKPTDPSIRSAYSLYLLRAGRPDLAEQVSQGGKIPEEPLLQPPNKVMPERFFERDPEEFPDPGDSGGDAAAEAVEAE